MSQLASFNIGVLRYDWDDPRVADFAENIDRVNNIAKRSPGFVWMLDDDAMDAAQNDPEGLLGGNPRTASTLSVWEDADSLGRFVWTTVHRAFYARRDEWYGPDQGPRLVLWRVAEGHRPTIAEAMDRLQHIDRHGPSAHAFGWDEIQHEATGWVAHRCGVAA